MSAGSPGTTQPSVQVAAHHRGRSRSSSAAVAFLHRRRGSRRPQQPLPPPRSRGPRSSRSARDALVGSASDSSSNETAPRPAANLAGISVSWNRLGGADAHRWRGARSHVDHPVEGAHRAGGHGVSQPEGRTQDRDRPSDPFARAVWPCLCGHLFGGEPGRCCPTCGTPAAETYATPSTGAVASPNLGGRGQWRLSAPQICYTGHRQSRPDA